MYFQFQSRAALRDYYAAEKAMKSNENIGMDEYMRRHSAKSLHFQEKRKQRFGDYKGKEIKEDNRRRLDYERHDSNQGGGGTMLIIICPIFVYILFKLLN